MTKPAQIRKPTATPIMINSSLEYIYTPIMYETLTFCKRLAKVKRILTSQSGFMKIMGN